MKKQFITNKLGHYFIVNDVLENKKLNGCHIHKSDSDMFEYICSLYEIDMDEEIQSNYIEIYDGMAEFCSGQRYEIEGSIEKFISEFIL